MEAMRDAWTDERLDDLNHRVDEGFGEMRAESRALRSEMQSEFTAVGAELRTEFGAVRSEAAAANRTMLQVMLGGFAVIVVGFGGTIATILSQG